MKTPLHLLTREDKIKLMSSFNSSFHRKDELLLPDEEIYPHEYTEEDVEIVGKKICAWLGVKPRNLDFKIQDTGNGFKKQANKNIISINTDTCHNPFESAAIIARGCVAYFLTRQGYDLDDELVEIGLTELGLGLLVINCLDSGSNFRSSFYRTFPIKHTPQVSKDILIYFNCPEYIRLFSAYVSRNELDHPTIMEHALPWIQKLIHLSLDASGKLVEPRYVISQRRERTQRRLKTIGIGTLLLIITIPGVIFWQNRPRTLSLSVQNHKEDIEVLAGAYKACENSLSYKQKKYDQSDIFMVRQIDAQLSRCQSLRNRHDHLVKIYNQEVASF